MSVKQIVILLLLIFSIPACAPKQTDDESFNQNINWSEETPESIKRRISVSASEIAILSAFFNLTMSPPPANMMSSMSGIITIDNRAARPKVRIRAFHLFGSTLFDMVNTDITKIYVPRKNTMYIGKQQEEESQKGPQTVFANMMLEPGSLVTKEDKALEIGEDAVILYLEDGWIALDKQSGLITTRHKAELDITYSGYRQLADTTLIPTRISITTTDGSYRAKCTLSQLANPQSLPSSFFDLAEYKPETIKNLQDLQEQK